MQSPWAEEFILQIGRGIDSARRGRSDQWIADRTEQLGAPLSRTAISEYRRGVRKTMPVTDWLVIAAALRVPPVALLFPGMPDSPVELLPDRPQVGAFDALMWVSGERQSIPPSAYLDADIPRVSDGESPGLEYRANAQYPGGLEDLAENEAPTAEAQVIKFSRELREAMEDISRALLPWEVFDVNSSLPREVKDAALEQYLTRVRESKARLHELQTRIERFGGTVQRFDDGREDADD